MSAGNDNNSDAMQAGLAAVGRMDDPPTLRDLFAMVALHGWVSDPAYTGSIPHTAAKMAYEHADAMIAERAVSEA